MTRETRTEGRAADFPVVVIGVAAGGMHALHTVVRGLSSDSGMAYVLIRHVASAQEEALMGQLAGISPLPVMEAMNGAAVKPNHFYVVPPERRMIIRSGALRFHPDQETQSLQPIDEFCFALAKERGSAAIGVVLSGKGCDGTAGLQSIQREGGITFAQEPQSAQCSAMPGTAISAGAADYVMRPRRISAELMALAHFPEKRKAKTRAEHLRVGIETAIEDTRAFSEELLASNEELHSVNEELSLAKATLLATNERLASLNEELSRRNSELAEGSGELMAMLEGLDIPIVTVDSGQRIRRFTSAAQTDLKLGKSDAGRPFGEVAARLNISDWGKLFAEVTDTLRVFERVITDAHGRGRLLRVRPHKTAANRINGVLVMLLDADPVKKTD